MQYEILNFLNLFYTVAYKDGWFFWSPKPENRWKPIDEFDYEVKEDLLRHGFESGMRVIDGEYVVYCYEVPAFDHSLEEALAVFEHHRVKLEPVPNAKPLIRSSGLGPPPKWLILRVKKANEAEARATHKLPPPR